ncbi:MAG: DUF2807 domain-containing protein [Chitinophagaceae bacterium]|nr:DUF2807 domain-containing protein [Chitinophagaceae bacterium]
MNNPKLIVGLGLVLLAGVIFFIGWDIQKRRADRHKNRNGATSSKTERISLEEIQVLRSDCVGDIEIIPSDSEYVEFRYDPGAFENQSKIKGNQLIIDFSNESFGMLDMIDHADIEIKVYSHSLTEIHQEGVGSISSRGQILSEHLTIENDGTGSMSLDLNTKTLKIINSGVGSIELKGRASLAEILNDGTGSVKMRNLILGSASVTNSGVGSVDLQATDTLDLINDGVGSIHYSGTAYVKRSANEGVGSIEKY